MAVYEKHRGPATNRRRTDRFDLRALHETSRLLSTSLELDFVLDNLLLSALSKLLVTRGAVLLWRPAAGAYRVAAAKGGLALEAAGDAGSESPLSALGAPPEMGCEPMFAGGVPGPLAERGVALALPLRSGERPLGLLALGPKATGDAFSDAEIAFVTSLVGMSAGAVGNALLVQELRAANRDLDGKVQEMNTLFDLSQEMGATRDPERLGRLLSFALMGQMTVRRHLFLMRRRGEDGGGARHPFRAAAASGARLHVTPALTDALCGRHEPLRLGETAPDCDTGEGHAAAWGALREAGFSIVLPIRQQGEVCAALALGRKPTGDPYTASDIEFLYALGNLAATSLQNARLVEEQIEMERLEREIALARDAQERLLPQSVPQVEGTDLAGRSIPSREVGGDYFDVFLLPALEGENDECSERLLLTVADVTGKGVPASLLMSNMQAALKALVPSRLPLEELAVRLNRVMCENTDQGTFVTFFAAAYDPATGTLDYVNGGHNPPMLLRGEDDGETEWLGDGGLLLGVMPGATYERGRVRLRPGDLLVTFTDGASEAMSEAGEAFGEARLEASLRAHRDVGSTEALLDAVFDDIRAFAGHPSYLSDDLTMIALQVEG